MPAPTADETVWKPAPSTARGRALPRADELFGPSPPPAGRRPLPRAEDLFANRKADPWAPVATTPDPYAGVATPAPDPYAAIADPWAPVKPAPPTSRRSSAPAIAAPVVDMWQRADRRAREGLREARDGGRRAVEQGLGANGDRLAAAQAALEAVGGVWHYATSIPAGIMESTVGRPVEALTHGEHPASGMGDFAENMLGFVAGPKGPKVRGVPSTRPLKPTLAGAADAVESVAHDAPPAGGIKVANVRGQTVAAKVEDPVDEIIYGPSGRRVLKLQPGGNRARAGMKEGIADAAGAVQKLLAPATVGLGSEGAAILRSNAARGDLMAAQTGAALAKHAKQVAELPEDQQLALIDYIQNRSKGATIPDRSVQEFANTHRKVMGDFEGAIERALDLDEATSRPFLQDYYAQMWKETGPLVESRILQSRQGSARNLKLRTIPTVREGIEAGLTPVTTNPVEMDMVYATNMSRYLATVNAQKELVGEGMASFHPVGAQPEGWVPLNGIRATKPGRYVIENGEATAFQPEKKLYAPPDVARVYNNFVSPGLEHGDAGPLFTAARKASNGMTMLKLGLSAFHATTMANEAVISEMARGYQSLSRAPALAARGNLGAATQQVGSAAKSFAMSPAGPVTSYLRGSQMRRELLGDVAPKSEAARLRNEAFVDAGGRVRMDQLYRARGSGSFYNALIDGTWKSEVKRNADAIFGKDRMAVERAGGVVDLAANLIQSTAAPLFEHAIPRLKLGAFDSTMADWMAANPQATPKQIRQAAHLINRSIDNRFGEMAWDNLFWHRWMKQASQIVLLSPSWNIGTINEIGGGILDAVGPSAHGLVSGGGLTTRTAYVAALATEVALINGVMTYLKTGTPPNGRDLLAYRTGGTDATSGQPERALMPGYQKDVYAFGHGLPSRLAQLFDDAATAPQRVPSDALGVMDTAKDNFGDEVGNKLNPALKTAIELSSNRDYRGLPIYPTDGARPAPGDRGLPAYLADQFSPISVSQWAHGERVGSNLSPAERIFAVRPAPGYLQSPERVERLKKLRERREWERKKLADRRDAARRRNN